MGPRPRDAQFGFGAGELDAEDSRPDASNARAGQGAQLVEQIFRNRSPKTRAHHPTLRDGTVVGKLSFELPSVRLRQFCRSGRTAMPSSGYALREAARGKD